ncbi:MAG: CpsB/CapC family capsule biosynthesis tyrosine phosphatase [Bacillota bacterium]|nr:CpsB/CapC family capsule biosynthesis tyrosine phosphatase [Bacillota bacterium]
MINIHSHILFGLDDGAKNMAESLEMANIAVRDGVKGIIATPHYGRHFVDYNTALMKKNFRILEEQIVAQGLPVTLYPGHEAYLDEFLLKNLKSGNCLTLAGSRYVLVEILHIVNLDITKRMLFDIACSQYVPVIAHCERLLEKKEDHHRLRALREMGCLLQVNVNPLLNTRQPWLKTWMHQGLKEKSISFVADDSHGTSLRPPMMKQAYEYIFKNIGSSIADEVLIKNPQKVISNQSLHV